MPGDFVAVDCETTGTDPERDRIVEVAVVRDGSRRAWRVFPGVPIPAEATAVHGIADADVAARPRFADVAHEVAAALAGAIVVTFNGRAFDLPLLRAEFTRAGFAWPLADAPVVDVLTLDRELTRHTLAGCVRRWCGREHAGAHGAEADAAATLDVLRAMLAAHPMALPELVALSGGNAATPCGRVLWGEDGRAVWGFGKLKGAAINSDAGFARWVAAKQDFPADVRALAQRAARGEDVRRAPQGA